MRHHRRGRNPDANKLIIYHNPTGAATFDPRITTSVSTTVIWETEAGRTVTTGTTHDLSYTPTAGPKVCKVAVAGGLQLITGTFDVRTDAITGFKNLAKTRFSTYFYGFANPVLQMEFSDLSPLINDINVDGCTALRANMGGLPRASTVLSALGCSNLQGSIDNLPPNMGYINIWPAAGVTGSIDNLPSSIYYLKADDCPLLTGSIDNLPTGSKRIYLSGDPLITGTNVARLPIIEFLFLKNQLASVERINAIIDSCYAGKDTFTHAHIELDISGNNAAPSAAQLAKIVELETSYGWIITESA
jgi:hypothetical protein